MIGLVYFVVIILANTVGAISGMGGGVIIKPVLDLIGAHSLAAISFYSAVAVFTMSIVSTLRQMKNKVSIRWKIALFVSLGAIVGGFLGNVAFENLLNHYPEEGVQLLQIGLTILTLLFAFFYARGKKYSWQLQGIVWYILVGFLLGFLASLLGIGGGPINVALLMLAFSLPIKEATVYSIITIFFSQLSKLVTIATTTGFGRYDLTILFYVVPAAIVGGFMGAVFSGKLPPEKVSLIYQGVILLVLAINLYNGVRIFI